QFAHPPGGPGDAAGELDHDAVAPLQAAWREGADERRRVWHRVVRRRAAGEGVHLYVDAAGVEQPEPAPPGGEGQEPAGVCACAGGDGRHGDVRHQLPPVAVWHADVDAQRRHWRVWPHQEAAGQLAQRHAFQGHHRRHRLGARVCRVPQQAGPPRGAHRVFAPGAAAGHARHDRADQPVARGGRRHRDVVPQLRRHRRPVGRVHPLHHRHRGGGGVAVLLVRVRVPPRGRLGHLPHDQGQQAGGRCRRLLRAPHLRALRLARHPDKHHPRRHPQAQRPHLAHPRQVLEPEPPPALCI
ncbi:hypothetical protein H4R21_003872, partial [Coemansia helicoidea]